MNVAIMAGGEGTRFWPWSVKGKPKQFLPLVSEETMLQLTYRRYRQWLPKSNIYIVTMKTYLPLIKEQLPELAEEQMIIEPDRKDTGPCIALTALAFLNKGDDEVLVVTPSDHYVADGEGLMKALLMAERVALNERAIVTLGMKPSRPETGYGYIGTKESEYGDQVLSATSFIEKPPLDKALQLFKRPDMFWNSGIFIWKPSTIAYYMSNYQSSMWNLLTQSGSDLEKVYERLPKISIDYAILEKAETIYMIPVTFVWDDLGTWTSLQRIYTPDSEGNIALGDVSLEDTSGSIIYSEGIKTIVVGVQDVIVAYTSNGLLVCHKSAEQRIKTMLNNTDNQGGGNPT